MLKILQFVTRIYECAVYICTILTYNTYIPICVYICNKYVYYHPCRISLTEHDGTQFL